MRGTTKDAHTTKTMKVGDDKNNKMKKVRLDPGGIQSGLCKYRLAPAQHDHW